MSKEKDFKLFEEAVNNLDEITVQKVIAEKENQQEEKQEVQKHFKEAQKIAEDVEYNPVLKSHLEEKSEHTRKRSLDSLKKRKYIKTVKEAIKGKKFVNQYISTNKKFKPKMVKRYDKNGNPINLGKIVQYRIFKSQLVKKADKIAEIKTKEELKNLETLD